MGVDSCPMALGTLLRIGAAVLISYLGGLFPGDSHIKVTGMVVVPFIGVKIRGLVPLAKMTTVRAPGTFQKGTGYTPGDLFPGLVPATCPL